MERQLETATDWGRYAELYAYDAEPQEYRLDEGAEGEEGEDGEAGRG